MLDIAYHLMEFLLCIIESLILYIFLVRSCSTLRIKNSMVRASILIGLMIMIFIKNMFSMSTYGGIGYSMFFVALYMVLQFKMEKWKYIFYTAIYVVICTICDFTVSELYCSIYSEATFTYLQRFHALRYNVALVSKLCSFSIFLILSAKEKETQKIPFTKQNIYILVVTIIITFISLYSLKSLVHFSIEWTTDPKIDILVCTLSITIFSTDMIVYWAIKRLNESARKEGEYLLIQCQNELLVKSAEENKVLEDEWHRIRHDFNNHISCIDMLLQLDNVDKARDYIQKLTQSSQPQTVSVHIGNDIADAIVNQKMFRAKKDSIKMEVEGTLPVQLKIEDVDLCAILSNSLDNAIEAACQVEDIQQRKIRLEIIEQGHQVWIKVINSVKSNTLYKGELKTTKKDKERHGIGMRSMQVSTERYKGKLQWSCDGSIFTLKIMFPL